MDGALIGFSFLSLCHPTLTFFLCPFSALTSVYFCNFYFLPALHLVSFYFFALETFPTHYRPLSPTDLLTYIFELKVVSSPSIYPPINLKCVTLIPTHLPALPPTYLPNPTYMATPTYVVAIAIDPQ
jgi:hypothetical protein